jgi:hypothetical protein
VVSSTFPAPTLDPEHRFLSMRKSKSPCLHDGALGVDPFVEEPVYPGPDLHLLRALRLGDIFEGDWCIPRSIFTTETSAGRACGFVSSFLPQPVRSKRAMLKISRVNHDPDKGRAQQIDKCTVFHCASAFNFDNRQGAARRRAAGLAVPHTATTLLKD